MKRRSLWLCRRWLSLRKLTPRLEGLRLHGDEQLMANSMNANLLFFAWDDGQKGGNQITWC
jgi:hypothetical protein